MLVLSGRFSRKKGPRPPVRVRGTSKSAVSRTFVAATRRKVEEELSRSLEVLDLAVFMLEGIVVKNQTTVVAPG